MQGKHRGPARANNASALSGFHSCLATAALLFRTTLGLASLVDKNGTAAY